MTTIIEYDTQRLEVDGTILVKLDTGKVLMCLSDKVRRYASPLDESAIPALQRALEAKPQLFVEVLPRTAPVEQAEVITAAGFTSDLTPEDRRRLRAITFRHWPRYFAQKPDNVQIDQLIDALGPEVAAKIVKSAVDGGSIH